MSRSNPTLDNQPHPCQRWFEWDGKNGVPKYYDKEKKENVVFPKPEFTFIPLDELCAVKGWHERSQSRITSNEVRDLGKEPMTVRALKGSGIIAQGLYAQIRESIAAADGYFQSNVYLAFKNGGGALALGCFQFNGSALKTWMDFRKMNRQNLYKMAVKIDGHEQKKNGAVVYFVPKFKLVPVSDQTNNEAIEVDKFLQDYFKFYFQRKSTQQVESTAQAAPESDGPPPDQMEEPPAEFEKDQPTEGDEAF